MIKFKNYTILLLLAWFCSPIVGFLFLIWFVSLELTPIFTIASVVYSAPYIILTAIYIFIFIRYKISTIKERLINLVPLVSLTIYWLIKNLIPYRVFLKPDQNDSPFDKWWYFSPQSAYGYPTPFYRIIDSPIEMEFKIIIDYASVISNIFMLFGCLFFTTIILTFINKKFNKKIPRKAPQ